jgi:hypothetical protein
MPASLGTLSRLSRWTLAGLLLAGCTTTPVQPEGNPADVILEAPAAKVREAFVKVLTEGGYEVVRGAGGDSEIKTGYRREISNHNWLYTSRFGVLRSKVTVTLSPEGDTATRVRVQVWSEGKSGEWMPLAGSWVPYDAAVPQSAANTIRLVKNELGLL